MRPRGSGLPWVRPSSVALVLVVQLVGLVHGFPGLLVAHTAEEEGAGEDGSACYHAERREAGHGARRQSHHGSDARAHAVYEGAAVVGHFSLSDVLVDLVPDGGRAERALLG